MSDNGMFFNDDDLKQTKFEMPDEGRHLFQIESCEERERSTAVRFVVTGGKSMGLTAQRNFSNQPGKRGFLVSLLVALGIGDARQVTSFKNGVIKWRTPDGRRLKYDIRGMYVDAEIKHVDHYDPDKKAKGYKVADIGSFRYAEDMPTLQQVGKPDGNQPSYGPPLTR